MTQAKHTPGPWTVRGQYVEAIEYGGGSASKSAERLASVRAAIAKATGGAA